MKPRPVGSWPPPMTSPDRTAAAESDLLPKPVRSCERDPRERIFRATHHPGRPRLRPRGAEPPRRVQPSKSGGAGIASTMKPVADDVQAMVLASSGPLGGRASAQELLAALAPCREGLVAAPHPGRGPPWTLRRPGPDRDPLC